MVGVRLVLGAYAWCAAGGVRLVSPLIAAEVEVDVGGAVEVDVERLVRGGCLAGVRLLAAVRLVVGVSRWCAAGGCCEWLVCDWWLL